MNFSFNLFHRRKSIWDDLSQTLWQIKLFLKTSQTMRKKQKKKLWRKRRKTVKYFDLNLFTAVEWCDKWFGFSVIVINIIEIISMNVKWIRKWHVIVLYPKLNEYNFSKKILILIFCKFFFIEEKKQQKKMRDKKSNNFFCFVSTFLRVGRHYGIFSVYSTEKKMHWITKTIDYGQCLLYRMRECVWVYSLRIYWDNQSKSRDVPSSHLSNCLRSMMPWFPFFFSSLFFLFICTVDQFSSHLFCL